MSVDIRKAVAVVPLAVLSALLAHQVRFGDDHAMGGEGNEALVGFAVASLVSLALAALWLVAREAPACASGSILARRLVDALPGSGRLIPRASAIAIGAVAIYFGIEALEHGFVVDSVLTDVLLPLAILTLVSTAVASGVLGFTRVLADLGVAIATGLVFSLLPGAAAAVFAPVARRRPLHAGRAGFKTRLGRAPPPR